MNAMDLIGHWKFRVSSELSHNSTRPQVLWCIGS